jgi:hypothetical protein
VFVFNAAFTLRGLTSGALLGGVFMAIWLRRGRSTPVVTGMLAALGVMLLIEILPQWSVTAGVWKAWVGEPIFWPWYTTIGVIVAVGVALLVRGRERAHAGPDQGRSSMP